MIRFDLYIGKLLYLSTFSSDEAFKMYRRWCRKGKEVQMKFVHILEEAA
jgi:hypothetical protein